jgi:hypothetical protein
MKRTGLTFVTLGFLAVLCAASASGDSVQVHRKSKPKKPELVPLPAGPTGKPVPQMPLESVTAIAPQVTYHGGQLTILAPNSTLGDILRAVRKQTGAEMDIPPNATERVVTNLGPGPAREVVAELLNGSRFNYVLLGSSADMNLLTRVVLVAKTDAGSPGEQPPGNIARAQPQPEVEAVADDASNDDSAEDHPEEEQPAEAADQPAAAPDGQGIKTPQQMLQEMQQRQLQLQQQQGQAGQPQPGYPQPGVPLPQRTQPDQQPPQQQ